MYRSKNNNSIKKGTVYDQSDTMKTIQGQHQQIQNRYGDGNKDSDGLCQNNCGDGEQG